MLVANPMDEGPVRPGKAPLELPGVGVGTGIGGLLACIDADVLKGEARANRGI